MPRRSYNPGGVGSTSRGFQSPAGLVPQGGRQARRRGGAGAEPPWHTHPRPSRRPRPPTPAPRNPPRKQGAIPRAGLARPFLVSNKRPTPPKGGTTNRAPPLHPMPATPPIPPAGFRVGSGRAMDAAGEAAERAARRVPASVAAGPAPTPRPPFVVPPLGGVVAPRPPPLPPAFIWHPLFQPPPTSCPRPLRCLFTSFIMATFPIKSIRWPPFSCPNKGIPQTMSSPVTPPDPSKRLVRWKRHLRGTPRPRRLARAVGSGTLLLAWAWRPLPPSA